MAEPAARDRKMAIEACRNWARDGALIHGEVARACAIAREEECAQLADSFTCGACGLDGKSGQAIRALVMKEPT